MKNFTKLPNLSLFIGLIIFLNQGLTNAQDFSFEQVAEDGLVVMEAENYDEIITQDGASNWISTSTPEKFSGTGAMQTEGGPYANFETDAWPNAAILAFNVKFILTGTHYIWARASHEGGGDDSFHAGINDDKPVSGSFINFEGTDTTNAWVWINNSNVAQGPAAVSVSEAGVQQLKIYIRENGFKIDKILLTTNQNYLIDDIYDVGPDETLPVVVGIENVLSNSLAFNTFPNPFTSVLEISYNLSNAAIVSIKVLDVCGREVAVLADEFQPATKHKLTWNVNNELVNGVYFIQLTAGSYSKTNRVVLIK